MVLNEKTQNQQTRDELGSEPSVSPIYKVKTDNIVAQPGPIVSLSVGIDNSFILGHGLNGLLNSPAIGVGGGQVVLGATDNTETVLRVINIRNIFNEPFNILSDVTTDISKTKYTMVDADNTTATLNESEGRIEF